MDKLEEHIRKNREYLDRYTPSSGVWKKIRKEIKKEKTSVRKWLSIAAMFVVILGTAIVFIKPGLLHSGETALKDSITNNAAESSQLKETEIYYNNLVNSLYREAAPMLTVNPEIQKELSSDISHIDSICSQIKRDLKDNIANQEVVEALIQNYRIKIRLLEDMLTVLKENETNPGKKKNHEL